MADSDPFEDHADRYDAWFEEHEQAYAAERQALRRLVSTREGIDSLEIGVGTGRFAAPLGLTIGIDPARPMLSRARERGLRTVQAVAETLPFADTQFDLALVVTTICFVNDVRTTLQETDRVLRPDGSLVLGYIDKESPVGQLYVARKDENPFYRDATFVTTDGIVDELEDIGFSDFTFVQTVFAPPDEMTAPGPVHEGYGDGSFVGVRARR